MATLTIRNVDDETHARLRQRAAHHGRSMEAEVRRILGEAVGAPQQNFLLALREAVGDDGVELPIPPRTDQPREVFLP